MFQFIKRKASLLTAEPRPKNERPDKLEQSVTKIAVELIQGKGGTIYQEGMRSLFRTVPTLIQDVDPKYRDALTQKLNRTDM